MAIANVDKGLGRDKLAEKYDRKGKWGEHPDYPLSGWKCAVTNGDTRRGYWEWVACMIEAEET